MLAGALKTYVIEFFLPLVKEGQEDRDENGRTLGEREQDCEEVPACWFSAPP